jgi:alpha-tubulin suppressor-like RCC1 family protein
MFSNKGKDTQRRRALPILAVFTLVIGLLGANVAQAADLQGKADASNFNRLVVNPDGTLSGWGSNQYGQVGDGTTTPRYSPVPVLGLSNVNEVALGSTHAFASTSAGLVYAWGYNQGGRLGTANSVTTPLLTPTQVIGLTDVVQVDAGYLAMALKSDGTVWTWNGGVLGRSGSLTVPGQVLGLSGAVQIEAEDIINASYVLLADGTVWGWGANSGGNLGNGTTAAAYTPVQASITDVVEIASAGSAVLALKSDGTVWGWGTSKLIDNTNTAHTLPVQLAGLSGVTSINAGYGTAFALLADGTVMGWGLNSSGEAGVIPLGPYVYPPTAATVFAGSIDFVADANSAFALQSDGSIKSIGYYAGLGAYASYPAATLPDTAIADTFAPVVAITSPANGVVTSLASIDVAWTVDGVAQTAQLTESLAVGSNVITRSATDAAGNTGTASVTVLRSIPDSDGDGVLDTDDLCPSTDLAGPVPLSSLRSNHMGDDMVIYGCNASQILACKPGENNGELKFGITPGTQEIFSLQSDWAANCQ